MKQPGLTAFVEHAPGTLVANEDLPVPFPDIAARTGIHTRHIADPDDTLEEIAETTVEKLLDRLQLKGCDCAGLVLASFGTSSRELELAARRVADRLDINGPVYGINYACSGFVAATHLALERFPGESRHVVIVTVELLSRLIDWQDKDSAILFGDRACACTLHPDGRYKILFAHAEEIQDDDRLITMPTIADALDAQGRRGARACIRIEGRPLYRLAPRRMFDLTMAALARLGLRGDDLSMLVHHQANGKFALKLRALFDQAGLERVQVADEIRVTGNVASCSIPCALSRLDECLGNDQLVACPAVGAGADQAEGRLTQGIMLLRATGVPLQRAAVQDQPAVASLLT